MDKALLFAYAETPVHHGGSESVGVIDLPVQREAASRLPTIWGQSAKGALRQHAKDNAKRWPSVTEVFGSEPPGGGGGDGRLTPGSLVIGDFRLAAFPVPTLDHVFAWATSPLLLARLTRMAKVAGVGGLPPVPQVGVGRVMAAAGQWGETGRVPVADYDLEIDAGGEGPNAAWAGWLADNALPVVPDGQGDAFDYFRAELRKRLLIVDDDQMKALADECAEVVARVQLSDEKTVNNLWYTEYLPAETLMVSLLRSTRGEFEVLRPLLDAELLVAGGDETVGKGLMWLRWLDADSGDGGAHG